MFYVNIGKELLGVGVYNLIMCYIYKHIYIYLIYEF